MAKKINRSNILEHLIENHLNLIEKTTFDILFCKNWKTEWSITNEQYLKFRKYSISLIKRTFKCNTNKAKEAFEHFMKNYGLIVK